jgi:DHA2 family multidrug resistance protein
VSTAVSVWLWNRRQDYHRTVLVEHITSTAPGWNAVHDSLAGAGLTEPTIHAVTAQTIAQQASTLACNDAYLLYAALLLGMIPVVWLARGPFRIGGGGMH